MGSSGNPFLSFNRLTIDNMVRLAPVLAAIAAAQDPEQPHLAQAWTAMSSGDGLPGAVGAESYYYSADGHIKAHKYEYPDCTKISLHDPSQLPHTKGGERNYYIKCDAVDCCYSDFSMKKWDIANPSMLTKVKFVAYEDTTELNENPVAGAEHWNEYSDFSIFKFGIAYDYYVHRTESSDVISHRINFNASGVGQAGEILYGNFTVQHDLDSFKQVFTPPPQCMKNNVLRCADQKVKSWEQKHFKHAAALRATEELSTTVV